MPQSITHIVRYRDQPNGPLWFAETVSGLSFDSVVETLADNAFACAEVEAVFALDEAAGTLRNVSYAVADAVAELLDGRDGADGLHPGISLFLHNNARSMPTCGARFDPHSEHRLTREQLGLSSRRAA